MTTTPFPSATVTGYPRIGPARELKRALEAHWSGRIDHAELENTARSLRLDTYARLRELGLTEDYAIPASFSYYDHVLDTAVAVGAVPQRFSYLTGGAGGAGAVDLDGYFALARGDEQQPPLEMTKWFDTNYHYLVPEISGDRPFAAHPAALLAQVREARTAGIAVRPVLVGPVTFLALSKPETPGDAAPLSRIGELVEVYRELLAALAAEGVTWVQLDEPALVTDRADVSDSEFAELTATAYTRLLAGGPDSGARPQVFVSTPYGRVLAGLQALADVAPEAVGFDLVSTRTAAGPEAHAEYGRAITTQPWPGTALVAGVVDGRNIWSADLSRALQDLQSLTARHTVSVSTSTSLLHVPYSLTPEHDLPPHIVRWLAFAEEKVAEVTALAGALAKTGGVGRDGEGNGDGGGGADAFARADQVVRERAEARLTLNEDVRERTASLSSDDRARERWEVRQEAQRALRLPALPTTTIGSFPQTTEVRRARADHRAGRISDEEYTAAMRAEIDRVIGLQERLDLDVLVHGEPERNDMVQYFAEHLDGFAATTAGWVQSYGSRCTRPPILFGDVSRPAPITVGWATYAASLTQKPVKGMLTGPVTILAWSFVRDDQPLGVTADQVGLALRDEVADLEAAGIRIIQVDEPALRELLPLREAEQQDYLEWSVGSFRLATSGVAASTQIHTHLCYSEFGEVISAIDGLGADVTSIEAARSNMEVLDDIEEFGFRRGIGPGVYDIHSPRVPTVEEITQLIEAALHRVGADQLWINPDCGLKTRGYAEVEDSLANLVEARRQAANISV